MSQGEIGVLRSGISKELGGPFVFATPPQSGAQAIRHYGKFLFAGHALAMFLDILQRRVEVAG